MKEDQRGSSMKVIQLSKGFRTKLEAKIEQIVRKDQQVVLKRFSTH